MPDYSALRLTEIELDSGPHEIQVQGELDLAVADQLDRRIGGPAGRRTLIDLSRCEFIDSTAIAVLLRGHRRAEEDGGALVLHSPRGQVLRVLEITGLMRDGLVFADRQEALAGTERCPAVIAMTGPRQATTRKVLEVSSAAPSTMPPAATTPSR